VNILFIVPYTPTPIRTRPYNLIRALARRGHQVTLATLWEDEAERQALDEWRAGSGSDRGPHDAASESLERHCRVGRGKEASTLGVPVLVLRESLPSQP
jgi:hypothetical protein